MSLISFLLKSIARIRRNHAIEHATIHMLSRRYRDLKVAGRSTPQGFLLYGDLPAEGVRRAAEEALLRLKAGERNLALHPTCGTNYVTGGVLAGLGAFAILTPRRKDWRDWLDRLPLVLLTATLGVIAGQRLGVVLQARLTTDANVGQAQIADVERIERGPVAAHRVRIQG
jgi:hypothetical protein